MPNPLLSQGRRLDPGKRGRTATLGCVVLWILLACVSTVQPVAASQVLDEVQLSVPFHSQDTLVWCWVAVAKMAVESVDMSAPSQCRMLEEVYGAPCCQRPDLCMRAGHITEISNLIERFGLSVSRMSFSGDGFQILKILRRTQAPIVAWVDGSHFVIIAGMKVVRTQSGPWGIVRIYDPIRGRSSQDWPVFSRRLGAILYIERDSDGDDFEECLRERDEGCMSNCMDDFGYSYNTCRNRMCNSPRQKAFNRQWCRDH